MKSNSKSIFNIFTLFALVTSLLGSALMVTPVYAAGITVTTIDDELNSDSDCSLREAIQAANTDSIVDACTQGSGADTITVPAGTYTLTIATTNEDANVNGDLDITSDITINGAGASTTIIQAGTIGYPGVANGIDRVFHVVGASTVSISGVTIANGKCTSLCSGGGILNVGTLTVTNSTFSGNFADLGGAITNSPSGTLTVMNSTFSSNLAVYGAGICNDGGTTTVSSSTFSGNSASVDGGGISNAGTLTVTNSTFSGNSSSIFGGGLSNAGTLTVTNSTFSGNTSSSFGGGISNFGGSSTLTVTNSTFSGNSAATGGGGGIYNGLSNILHLKNTIIANSPSGSDCYNGNGNGDTIATNINNLIETNGPSGNMCGSPTVTSDPALGALADNGGPTQTFALLAGSPAIDAGDNTICDDVPPGPNNLDQRGVTRPQNSTCDIGAYETESQPGPTFTVNTNADTNDTSCDPLGIGLGNQDCTLREAINAANSINGSDTINFDANYTITTGSQLPVVITGIVINGNGAANTIIQANTAAEHRVFEVGSEGSLTLDSLTVRHGVCDGVCATDTGSGGGVYNADTLIITDSVISDNSATSNGGGIYNTSNGILTVTNSTFSGNSATSNGGGIYSESGAGTAAITNSTLYSNSAASGGGIYNNGTDPLIVTNSTLSTNSASTSGGGIYDNIGTATLYNTIVAGSTSGGDCSGSVTADSNNLDTDGTCGSATQTTTGAIDLGSLADNGGPTQTMALGPSSVAIGAGDDTICAAAPVNNTSQNGLTRPQGTHCDIGSYELPFFTVTLKSVAANDGWVLESTETSGVGGTLNSSAVTFNLGDDAADKQYRAILHFNTSSLPDTAVITKATLKIKKQGQVGTNPFTLLGGLRVDMRKPSFGAVALAIGDFQVAAGRSTVSTFGVTPVSNWYSAVLNGSGRNYINKTGNTQFRLQFATDDNNDNGADYMKFFSGNAPAATRPQLIINYYVP